MRGKLIFLFGLDGSGKSTITKMLNDRELKNTVFTSCMTNAIFDEELLQAEDKLQFSRKNYFSNEFEYVLHTNSIIYKMFNVILPILNNGKNVVLDRYTPCAKLYADLFLEPSHKCLARSLECLPSPDLGIYFDVEIETSLSRLEIRSNTTGVLPHFSESKKSLAMKKARYETIILEAKYAILKIDANQDIEKVYSAVIKILNRECALHPTLC